MKSGTLSAANFPRVPLLTIANRVLAAAMLDAQPARTPPHRPLSALSRAFKRVARPLPLISP